MYILLFDRFHKRLSYCDHTESQFCVDVGVDKQCTKSPNCRGDRFTVVKSGLDFHLDIYDQYSIDAQVKRGLLTITSNAEEQSSHVGALPLMNLGYSDHHGCPAELPHLDF